MLPEEDPSVTIDLNNNASMNSLIIYASSSDSSDIICHFEVMASTDQKNWEELAFVTPDWKNDQPVKIDFDSPQNTRYLRIEVSGSRRVILDEVEVY